MVPSMATPFHTIASMRPRSMMSRLYFNQTGIISSRHLNPAYSLRVSHRLYATQIAESTGRSSDQPRRRAVTPFNDDGRVPWGQLSPAEKISRTAQQSFNFVFITGGAVLTVLVVTVLYTDVFSPSSHITQYNHAVDRVREDRKCQELLGSTKSISALGPATGTSWIRQRPQAQIDTDKYGTERMKMSIRVTGDKKEEGVIGLHMVRRADERQWGWGQLYLDVRGKERVWLERGGEQQKKQPGKFFGIKWR